MQAPTEDAQVDPFTRYIVDTVDGSPPRLAINRTCPIALSQALRDNPYTPWTASRPATRNTIAGGSVAWPNIKNFSLTQSHEDAQWELDDIQESLIRLQPDSGQRHGSESSQGPDQRQTSKRRADAPAQGEPSPVRRKRAKLRLPVVLPQRRPKWHSRGFVKGYAPALSNHGISEVMFLEFLDRFEEKEEGNEPNKISAANLASDGVSGPDEADWPSLVAIDLKGSAGNSKGTQPTHRMNGVLEAANDEIFRPRGLYCLATSYMPDAAEGYHRVKLLSPAALHMSYGSSQSFRHIPAATRRIRGNTFWMEAAPLVFPGLDTFRNELDQLAEVTKSRTSKMQQLVHDYYSYSKDRTSLEQNHESSIFSERSRQTLMSRYAHPQDIATTGSFMSLSSGQYINVPPMTKRQTAIVKGSFVSKKGGLEQEVNPSAMDETVRRTADLSMNTELSNQPSGQGSPGPPEPARSQSIATTTLKKVSWSHNMSC